MNKGAKYFEQEFNILGVIQGFHSEAIKNKMPAVGYMPVTLVIFDRRDLEHITVLKQMKGVPLHGYLPHKTEGYHDYDFFLIPHMLMPFNRVIKLLGEDLPKVDLLNIKQEVIKSDPKKGHVTVMITGNA